MHDNSCKSEGLKIDDIKDDDEDLTGLGKCTRSSKKNKTLERILELSDLNAAISNMSNSKKDMEATLLEFS